MDIQHNDSKAAQEIADEKKKLGIADDPDEPEEKDPKDTLAPPSSDKEDDDEDEEKDPPETVEDPDKEDDDEEEEIPENSKQVPYGKVKKIKDRYKTEISDLKEQLRKATTAKEKEAIKEDISTLVKETAEKLGMDEKNLAGILDVVQHVVDKKMAPYEKMRSEQEKTKEQREADEQTKIFNTEWSAAAPSLKEQYPTATPEQLEAAKAEMDKLSHSEKHHTHDMDYILYKNKSTFDTIFKKAGKKTFESPRHKISEDDKADPTNDGTMTPNQVQEAEARINKAVQEDKEPMRIFNSETGESRDE